MVQMMTESISRPGRESGHLHIFRAREDATDTIKSSQENRPCTSARISDVETDSITNAKPKKKSPAAGVNFPKILKSLKAIGYKGAIDLDVIGAFTYPLSRQMA